MAAAQGEREKGVSLVQGGLAAARPCHIGGSMLIKIITHYQYPKLP